ncbi:hypothetical protein pb186bvf_005461 [Paramecium bursaria]
MSDLHKQALKNAQKKPPLKTKQFQEDSEDSQEENDKFEEVVAPQPVKLAGVKPSPIKADHNIGHQHTAPKQPTKKIHDYSPQQWDEYYDEMIYLQDGTPLYIAGDKAPIFLCLHGAGHSAMSFANLALQIKQFATLISFDFRGHGKSKLDNQNVNLSVLQLTFDVTQVLDELMQRYTNANFIIVGHSMGGAIAAKVTNQLLQNPAFADRVQGISQYQLIIKGLVVIDVVEGTAMEALPFMDMIIKNRPKQFKSYEQAIQWSINSSTLKTLASARISIPAQLQEVKDEAGNLQYLGWRVDLLKTEPYWKGWFEGLTQCFLDIRIPKILMLAEKERLDKDLTVAQMQGKFRLVVLVNTGHSIQEDDPINTAAHFHDLILKFRIPCTVQEFQTMKEIGVGKFHPKIPDYQHQFK